MSTSQETGQPSVAPGNGQSVPQSGTRAKQRVVAVFTEKGVRARGYCGCLQFGLQALRKRDTLCDFSLFVEDQEFKVHKVVMAANSGYFLRLLTSDMCECRKQFVELPRVTAKGLKVVLDFVYTSMLALTLDNVGEVLLAAICLQVKIVVILCSKYLEKAVNVVNCVQILNLAEDYSLTKTFTHARRFILKNFELVANSKQYFNLKTSQLASLLAENGLRVRSECRLFELVMRWIDHEGPMKLLLELADHDHVRKPFEAELMSKIRFPLMTWEELVKKVSPVPEMRDIPECAALLTEAKNYHINVSIQPVMQSERTQVRSIFESLVMYKDTTAWSYTFYNQRIRNLRKAPTKLYSLAIVAVDNFMFACGGIKSNVKRNETTTTHCFRYDPRFDSWYELTSMIKARRNFVVVALGGKLYAVGGQDRNGVKLSSVECFTIASNKWELRESIPNACHGHAGAVCLGKIYISGGEIFSGVSNNLYCYTPEEDTWEDRASMLNERCDHIMVEVGEKLYVIGGYIQDGSVLMVSNIATECYCPLVDQWTLCRSSCNIREAGVSVLDGKVYIVGGINGEYNYSDLLQTFDPVQDETKKLFRHIHIRSGSFKGACCVLRLPRYV